jgi:hypothetical protein
MKNIIRKGQCVVYSRGQAEEMETWSKQRVESKKSHKLIQKKSRKDDVACEQQRKENGRGYKA